MNSAVVRVSDRFTVTIAFSLNALCFPDFFALTLTVICVFPALRAITRTFFFVQDSFTMDFFFGFAVTFVIFHPPGMIFILTDFPALTDTDSFSSFGTVTASASIGTIPEIIRDNTKNTTNACFIYSFITNLLSFQSSQYHQRPRVHLAVEILVQHLLKKLPILVRIRCLKKKRHRRAQF